jgi:phosphoglycolate phosphatase-like HAD superfamily hydrolase
MDGTVTGLDILAFDFDGVLCQSVEVKTAAFAALYADHGPEVVAAVVAHHRAHGGVNRLDKIRHYESALLGRPADEAAIAAKARRFACLVVDNVIAAPLMPGAEAFLDAHAGHLPLYVVSGTPQEELRHILAAKTLDRYFRGTFGAPTAKSTHLAAILKATGAAPDRAAMVGDALTDFNAAAACHMRFVGLRDAGGGHPFPPPTPVLADLTDLARALADAPVARAP